MYAIDPTKNHDDCMEQLAANGIYVVADLGEPGTSIESNNPMWDVELYQRYISVIDSLSKYKNVIGFLAGNENVSAGNQTAAAAFVEAAIRDMKGYIASQNYRKTLGVGYATADVPTRDDLAHYFACEPGDSGETTVLDFWGYNVYSWCGQSSYRDSSYDEREDFFHDYPVPVFFAEYGCIEGIDGGPTNRPFEEVQALYGNMTDVFSGGIVYEYFMGDNVISIDGLVSVDGDNVSPYPDFTSLKNQLGSISPTTTMKNVYKPSNSHPACPSATSTWEVQAFPLPPSPNAKMCDCIVQNLECSIKSDNEEGYADIFNYICSSDEKLCVGIAHNATTGQYGALSGCNPKDQLSWVAHQYYLENEKGDQACDFDGAASKQKAQVADGCQSLIDAVGAEGTGAVVSPTGKAEPSKSKGAAASLMAPTFFEYGTALGSVFAFMSAGSFMGMLML